MNNPDKKSTLSREVLYTILVSGGLFGAAWVVLLSPGFVVIAFLGYPILAILTPFLGFLIFGVPFGVLLGLFQAYQTRRFLALDLVPESESLVYQGGANHFKGIEGVGGWLYLTDQALRFKSHELNFQPHEMAIPLTEIVEVDTYQVMGVFPTGLLVTTQAGRSERFVVHRRSHWRRLIRDAQEGKVESSFA